MKRFKEMFFENREEFDKIYNLMVNDFEMFLVSVPINYTEYNFKEFIQAYFGNNHSSLDLAEEMMILLYLNNKIITTSWNTLLENDKYTRWDKNDLHSTIKMYLKHFPKRQKATVKISWDDYKNKVEKIKIHCVDPFNYVINLTELEAFDVKVICDYLSENDFVDVDANIGDVIDVLEASFSSFSKENYSYNRETMHFRAETTIQDFYDLAEHNMFKKFFKNLKP